MNKKKVLNQIRQRRKKRARIKIIGTAERPRLSVFRSNRFIYAQLIDDEKGRTLASVSVKGISSGGKEKIGKIAAAEKVGEKMAEKAAEKNIKKAVFDRGNYKYLGRVKAVAEGARKKGLIF